MTLRVTAALLTTLVLWALVKLQINEANKYEFLTVEQMIWNNVKGLSFDRHYAMPLDFCIIAPFIGLSIFLCGAQWGAWGWRGISLHTGVAALLTVGLVIFWSRLPTPEAHQQGLTGIYHGAFFWIALTVAFLVMTTPNPPPVLMLSMCIVLPAFLFVGNHMFLGMINYDGAAATYPDKPLQNMMGWGIITVVFVAVAARSYIVIPSSFWQSLN